MTVTVSDMKMQRQRGFTLIEVLIVVAIIGVLAALAVPRYVQFTMRARQAEAMTIIGIIKNQQFSFNATHDCFADTIDNPGRAGVGPTPQTWNAMGINPAMFCGVPVSFSDAEVDPLNSQVYYSYDCDTGGALSQDVTCSAVGDLNGNGMIYELVWCLDGDSNGMTAVSPLGSPCAFPGEPYRVSAGIF